MTEVVIGNFSKYSKIIVIIKGSNAYLLIKNQSKSWLSAY